ncbi:RNA polymerase subunit sigma [Flavobacterium akiainvivens]|uniref:RNA polymerase subunit sigma n=1 Tax=Flavobacterium akiainvivens TaxID=1202724 RepID=A0A0M8M9R7_9FLAO|nr:RNA polymerase sigma-70 factor [Flavobacterium akiainvivens]KOS05505.1 RNA polymerase subunit sigma [Flavobacterium akiainvivens]
MKTHVKDLPDIELQKRMQQGDRHAFDVLFHRYWKRLFAYAYKIFNEAEVCEDIVQELFISLWNNAPQSNILNLEAYLLRAVKYRIANHIRSLKFERAQLDIIENIGAPTATVDDIEYKQLEANLMEKVQQFPPKCREVFMLSRFENCSNAEIAQRLNISVHTVEKHITHALRLLKNNIGTWNITFIVMGLFL